MDKHVASTFLRCDETIAFVRVEPFNGADSHLSLPADHVEEVQSCAGAAKEASAAAAYASRVGRPFLFSWCAWASAFHASLRFENLVSVLWPALAAVAY